MEIIIVNSAFIGYFILVANCLFFNKHKVTDNSMHHILSHSYIVGFFMISTNLYIYKDLKTPFVISFLYLLQHLIKENIRLIKTNKWSEDVCEKDDM